MCARRMRARHAAWTQVPLHMQGKRNCACAPMLEHTALPVRTRCLLDRPGAQHKHATRPRAQLLQTRQSE